MKGLVDIGPYGNLDEPDRLMAKISQGIASWYTYEKFCGRRSLVFEHSFYGPLCAIAKAQGWQVSHEYRVRRSENIKRRLIDFVLHRERMFVAVEVKFVGSSSERSIASYFSNQQYIPKDIENLTYFFKEKRNNNTRGYILLIGGKKLIGDQMPIRPKKPVIRHVYSEARKILEGSDCAFYEAGWRCDEVGEDINKVTVLVLRNNNAWHRLEVSPQAHQVDAPTGAGVPGQDSLGVSARPEAGAVAGPVQSGREQRRDHKRQHL